VGKASTGRIPLEAGWTKAIPVEVAKAIWDGEGYYEPRTIYKTEAFIRDGLSPDIVAFFALRHFSDTSHPKSTIFDNQGKVVDHVDGILPLNLSTAWARDLCGFSSDKMGRAAAHSENVRAIMAHYDLR